MLASFYGTIYSRWPILVKDARRNQVPGKAHTAHEARGMRIGGWESNVIGRSNLSSGTSGTSLVRVKAHRCLHHCTEPSTSSPRLGFRNSTTHKTRWRKSKRAAKGVCRCCFLTSKPEAELDGIQASFPLPSSVSSPKSSSTTLHTHPVRH